MKKFLNSRLAKVLVIAALAVNIIWPIFNAIAAGAYTITYVDANGAVLGTDSANAGDVVNLSNYPSGAIAWVDNSANVSGVSSSAKGMAYVNYNLSSPAPAEAQPFTMTMPARNVTLAAFYGDYQNGNEPRLIQFHLELKYHDINSGCDLAYAQEYQNINAPSGYVISLPGPDFFQPMSVTASGCTNPAQNGTTTAGLSIYKWVYDAAYTGLTVPPDDLLYDPTQMIYVDPNNYNEIYNVMVDQTLDWETGEDVQSPDPSNPPVPGIYSTVTFQVDNTIWTSQTDDTPAGVTSSIGGGFDYAFTGTNSDSGQVLGGDPALDENVLTGSTWSDWFGVSGSAGNVPTHIPASGYIWWWTVRVGDNPSAPENIVAPNSIAPNFVISDDLTYTLHYAEAPQLVPIVISFNTGSQVYDGSEWTVRGFTVTSFDGTTMNIADTSPATAASKVVDLGNGYWLVLASKAFDPDIDAVSGTAVGTYALVASPRDFTVYDGDPSSGGTIDTGFNIIVRAGGLTITPTLIDNGLIPGNIDDGGSNNTGGGEDPDTPNTGARPYDGNNSSLPMLISSLSSLLLLGTLFLMRSSNKSTK
jgi:hypothetical protein